MKRRAFDSTWLGKFSNRADARVYRITLDGADEEIGEADSFGWYGRVNGRILGLAKAGAIVREDYQGFVTVEYYDDPDKLARHWDKIEQRYERFEAEAEAEAEE